MRVKNGFSELFFFLGTDERMAADENVDGTISQNERWLLCGHERGGKRRGTSDRKATS